MAGRTLLIEGWRHVPHSYAMVNQYHCLELLRIPGLTLRHRDVAYPKDDWRPVTGLFPPEDEEALRSIPTAGDDLVADALLRIAVPYNWGPSRSGRTCVFATTEHLCVPDRWLPPGRTLGELAEESDLIVVTPSRRSREGLLRGGIDPARVAVVPHGVDPSIYRPPGPEERAGLRARLGWDGFVFLAVGAMTGNKGIALLLKAFAEVARVHPTARLVLKGLEALYPSGDLIARQAAGLTTEEAQRVQDRLTYLGQTYSVSDMARLYQAADAYVSAYFAEGFNLPALEAAACGTLVICTRGGPTDEFLRPEFALPVQSTTEPVRLTPGTTGECLVPDEEHLRHQMTAALVHPELAARARAEGPPFVARGFTWRHAVASLLRVLFPEG